MDEFSKKLEIEVSKLSGAAATLLLLDLMARTPVDTGLAASSWKLRLDSNNQVISNDVPYIEHLNHGSSKQAPSHFVERTALQYGVPRGAIVEYKP
jgi:hypothetical protein